MKPSARRTRQKIEERKSHTRAVARGKRLGFENDMPIYVLGKRAEADWYASLTPDMVREWGL